MFDGLKRKVLERMLGTLEAEAKGLQDRMNEVRVIAEYANDDGTRTESELKIVFRKDGSQQIEILRGQDDDKGLKFAVLYLSKITLAKLDFTKTEAAT